jgi:hypothetical protein
MILTPIFLLQRSLIHDHLTHGNGVEDVSSNRYEMTQTSGHKPRPSTFGRCMYALRALSRRRRIMPRLHHIREPETMYNG